MDKIAKRAREKEMERRQKQSGQDKRIARLRKTYTDRGLLFHIGGRDEKTGCRGVQTGGEDMQVAVQNPAQIPGHLCVER